MNKLAPAHQIVANLDAEFSVIGSLLYQNDVLAQAVELKAEHFTEPACQEIWRLAAAKIEAGERADPVSIADRLGDHAGFVQLGGLRFLADLVSDAYPATFRAHADIVINAARLRAVHDIADTVRRSVGPGVDAFDLIAEASRDFTGLLEDSAPPSQNLVDAQASAVQRVDAMEEEALTGRQRGAMTGLRCFDRRLRGLRPGNLVVVAGRPGMSKTALARVAALGCARLNPASQVLFFALEMDRSELDDRTLAQMSHEEGRGIPYKDMDGSRLTMLDRMMLRDLTRKIPNNLVIDDSAVLSVDHVRRRVLAQRRKAPVAAVFIDYLQIMQRPEARGRNEASVIGEMTSSLKRLAREADCCVVLLSQINRGVESRDDKRPQLSDLRESGSIEQDANAVLFPFRPFYYLERAEPTDPTKRAAWETECEITRRKLDVYAAKVRQGPVGVDHQTYFAEYDVIEDVVEDRR